MEKRQDTSSTQPSSLITQVDPSQSQEDVVRKETESEIATVTLDHDTTSLYIPLLSRGMIRLYWVWIPIFMSTLMAGYAFGAMTAINTLPSFQDYFNLSGVGVSTGLIFGLWPIAACCTFWLGPIVADRFGRVRAALFGSITFFIGSTVFAFAQNVAMLLVGRAFCGAGNCMLIAASPTYLVETCPPLKRGLFAGLFNTVFLVGFCLATCIGIGATRVEGEWGWRMVLVIQMIFPVILSISTFFIPDTPRWLYNSGHPEKALAVLQRYHGSGELTAVVRIEYEQIARSVQAAREKVLKRWNFRNLANTKANRYRLMLALVMGAFGQLSGYGLGLFFPQILAQIGYVTPASRLSMHLIASVAGLLASTTGSLVLDRVGRRKLLILGSFACCLTLMGSMVAASQSGVPLGSVLPAENPSASRAGIACFVLFMAAYGMSYQPLLPTYPSEVLSTDQRSTGMGLTSLTMNLAIFINLFAIPVALERIGWWVYLPFIVWTLVESITWYLIAVETKGRSLEELDAIFESKNPVRASLIQTTRLRGAAKV